MTVLAKCYYEFLNQILPAYLEGNVPLKISGDLIDPPYITYTFSRADMFQQSLEQVRIWTYSSSMNELLGYLDIIENLVSYGGVLIDLDGGKGSMWIKRGTPFIQRQPMDETNLMVGYVNLIVQSLIM